MCYNSFDMIFHFTEKLYENTIDNQAKRQDNQNKNIEVVFQSVDELTEKRSKSARAEENWL